MGHLQSAVPSKMGIKHWDSRGSFSVAGGPIRGSSLTHDRSSLQSSIRAELMGTILVAVT